MRSSFTIKENHCTLTQVEMRMLSQKDLDAILTLQDEIYNGIEDKQTYIKSTKEELMEELLHYPTHTIGIFTAANELIAVGIYKTVGQSEDNYARDFGLEGTILDKIGHVDTTIVSARFRGNGLQRILIEAIEELARKDHMQMLCATVSPYNTFSLNSFLKTGFVIKADKLKYGGVRRYIVAKDLV